MKKKKSRLILAIDPSIVETGYAVIRDGVVLEKGTIKTTTNTEYTERLHIIYEKVSHITSLYKPHALAIETQYIDFGKASNAVLKTTEVKGIIVGAYWSHCTSTQVIEIHPKSVKSFLGLPPRAKRNEAKQISLLYVSEYCKETIKNNNISDAVLIGLIGEKNAV